VSKWKNLSNGKTVKRNGLRIPGQFAPRLIDLLESPAYRTLHLPEHRILARLEIELAHHGGLENGSLIVTYEQFMAYGVRLNSIAPAIRTLIALGFIRVKLGRGGNSEFYQPNRFELTYRKIQAKRYGDVIEESNDWKRVKTLDEAQRIAKVARSEKTKTGPKKKQKSTLRSVERAHSTKRRVETPGSHSTKRRVHPHYRNVESYLESWGGGGAGDGEISKPSFGLTADSSSVVPFPGRRAS
jgi:hypothetical protein